MIETRTKERGWIIGFAVPVLLLAAVLIRWADNFYADDSYFYFQVAWNIARGMGSTFNNVIPTNGYHPLWMLVCVAVFKVFPDKNVFVHAIAGVIAVLDAAALVMLARLLRRWGNTVWWPAVFLYGAFAYVTQLGTEGALSGCLLAAMLLLAGHLLLDPRARLMVPFALCAALAVLARLDSVFVVGLVTASVYWFAWTHVRRSAILGSALLFPALWGAYVASNLVWFGTVQPISGMLKSHSKTDHVVGHNLPHVAVYALMMLAVATVVLAWKKRDAFFLRVELPFLAGVLIHAGYIAFVMSSETRWTWYYTSWWVLAAVMVSRAVSVVVGARVWMRQTVAAVCLLLMLTAWWKTSYRASAHYDPDTKGVGYQENIVQRAGLHRVLAFDKPGRMAYYSDLQVIALDGLMGDLQFQKDLETKGIAAFARAHDVDGFVGPPVPFDLYGKHDFCDNVYLSSVQLHCVDAGNGLWKTDAVKVYARMTGASAGEIALHDNDVVWDKPMNVAVWRIAR